MLLQSALLLAQSKVEREFLDADYFLVDSAKASIIRERIYTDTIAKSGTIRYFSIGGALLSTGEYSNLLTFKKEGPFKFYHPSGEIQQTSNFVDDQRHGEFCTYYQNGQLRRRDFYSNGKFVTGSTFTPDGKDTSYFEYEVLPEFQGGEAALVRYLNGTLKYPRREIRHQKYGTVYLSFVITQDGKADNIRVTRSLSPLLDAEAKRVIAGMPAWKPGMSDGYLTRVRYSIPVKFTLR